MVELQFNVWVGCGACVADAAAVVIAFGYGVAQMKWYFGTFVATWLDGEIGF